MSAAEIPVLGLVVDAFEEPLFLFGPRQVQKYLDDHRPFSVR